MAAPTTQATNVVYSVVVDVSFKFNVTSGDGAHRIAFMKAASTGSPVPVDTTTYTTNAAFGSGTQIGSTGWYAVPINTTITGLTASTTYRVMVCEYNGNAGAEEYLVTTATGNPANQATQATPSVDAGTDQQMRGMQVATLAATSVNCDSVLWTSSGTGTFSDATSLTSTYTHTDADHAAGKVILTLTGTRTGFTDVTDTMTMYMVSQYSGGASMTAPGGGAVITWQFTGQPQGSWPDWVQRIAVPNGQTSILVRGSIVFLGGYVVSAEGGLISIADATNINSNYVLVDDDVNAPL